MTFAGLTLTQIGTLLGALGGATLLLYLLKLRRRRVEVPFSPLWARVVEERRGCEVEEGEELACGGWTAPSDREGGGGDEEKSPPARSPRTAAT